MEIPTWFGRGDGADKERPCSWRARRGTGRGAAQPLAGHPDPRCHCSSGTRPFLRGRGDRSVGWVTPVGVIPEFETASASSLAKPSSFKAPREGHRNRSNGARGRRALTYSDTPNPSRVLMCIFLKLDTKRFLKSSFLGSVWWSWDGQTGHSVPPGLGDLLRKGSQAQAGASGPGAQPVAPPASSETCATALPSRAVPDHPGDDVNPPVALSSRRNNEFFWTRQRGSSTFCFPDDTRVSNEPTAVQNPLESAPCKPRLLRAPAA